MTDHTFSIDELYRGTVYDSDGDKIGAVKQVYTDDTTGEPQFVTVNTGLFGSRESFVPVSGATRQGDDIHVPYTKAFVKDAPGIEADGHMEESEQDELFRYYDYSGGGRDTTTYDRDTTAGVGGVGGLGDGSLDRDRDRDLDLDRDRTSDLGDESIVRREEQLNVGTERVETGRLRIRKHVVTEQQTVTVPVEREEFEVVREPITGTSTGGTLGDDEIAVTTHAERPVVDKDVVDAERIGVEKRTVTDQERVSAEVSKEQVDIDRDGDVDRDRDRGIDGDGGLRR
ncbi:DUF2382 domain-containing protein [Agrococcus jenensis]|uniref:Uncharacterized protein (TIGR02271 family) n=1 Tax=Agrococcus jenensis TaxID=46353 RepID=A0A3N2AR15_9MICO|nr:PRC and DUF2382 domain-containing protein [Agrococcus jenensis]ROR65481.1 uncharacterized protein (TIGR02271 family) [Agrococcus jenensis]